MNLEELWEIKEKISAEIKDMNLNEKREYFKKSTEWLKDRAGRENFVQTSDPYVWKHIAKKKVSE